MSCLGISPAVGRTLPDEEVTLSVVSLLESRRAMLRQRTLFEYGMPTTGLQHERGLPKVRTEFESSPQNSIPWGDPIISGRQVLDSGIFRLVSHNVNGLSPANDNADVVNMAASMADKEVAIFGLQETNRNFEQPSMVESFHRVIRNTSTHHNGAVSSAKLQWPQDYQPMALRYRFATSGQHDFCLREATYMGVGHGLPWQVAAPRKSRSSRRIEYVMELRKRLSRQERSERNKNGCMQIEATHR
jgi:hypothetical protein